MKKQNIFSYLFFNKKWIITTAILVVLAGLFAEVVPFLQGQIVSLGIEEQNQSALINILLILAGAVLLDAFTKTYIYILTNKIGFTASENLRTDFFAKLVRQPYQFFVQKRSGDMVFRSNIFIYSIGNFVSKNLGDIAIGFTRVIIIFVYMLVLNVNLALILAAIYLMAILFALLHSKLTYKLGKAYKHLELHRNSLILQNLDNMETYLAYNDDFSYLKNYTRVDSKYHKVRAKYHLSKHLFYPCLDFFVSLGTVLIYELTFAYGLDIIQVGVLVAMLTYANRIVMPIQNMAEGLSEIVGTGAIVSKIFGFLQKPCKTKKVHFKGKSFDIVCKDVCHTDSATGASFENLNLSIPFGSHVAISGAYGNGKSAFAELLLGLDEAQSGTITFNNTNVLSIRRTSIHKLISMAEDHVGIFDGTIFENVHFARPSAKEKEVVLAMKQANLMPVLNALPKGAHTEVSKTKLSEGTKQLIAFARLILKNTPVIIIDEFERDLDEKSKAQFHKSLEQFCKNKTLIYICQKPPKNLKFDQIISFEQKS